FLHTKALAAANGIALPGKFDSVLLKMLEVIHALSRGGPPEGFGDDDGGRVFNPRRNRADHLTDPLAMGAALFKNGPFGSWTALTEEAIWLFGEHAISAVKSPHDSGESCPRAFPDGGVYILADSNGRLVIDAGPQGVGNSGHGHADALGVSLFVKGH